MCNFLEYKGINVLLKDTLSCSADAPHQTPRSSIDVMPHSSSSQAATQQIMNSLLSKLSIDTSSRWTNTMAMFARYAQIVYPATIY
jgi:hypothetical protein